MVGAVVVADDEIVGEGAHLRLGGGHAEVDALAAAGESAAGATMYVTLEPCSFHGRTPPCTDAVRAAGVRRVVCAMLDPDPRVSGTGVAQLRQAGVEVCVGVLETEAESLNAAYVKHRRKSMPLCTLKLAQTLDGQIATALGDSRWITGEQARRHAHRWRSWTDAIMVGAGTVLADDPDLSVRHVRGRDPRPFVVDGRLRVSPDAAVFAQAGATLVTTTASAAARRARFAESGVTVWTFAAPGGRIDLRQVVRRIASEGITSLLIEGGGELAAGALRDRVVDRVQVYIAPRMLGAGVPAVASMALARIAQAVQLEDVQTRRLGPDLLYSAQVRYACSRD
jgi:diaminohydroxyphosphoribosylaminopyrimidine deaminase/5-amino-6-(5-phosphoribosylamino)uracil reductase